MEVKPGYKRTEVGVTPEDWEVTTLAEVCTFENGDRGLNYPSPGSFVQSGIPFINAGHLAEGKIDISGMNYITSENYNRLGSGKVRGGDILFCLRGSLGKFGIVRDDFGKGAIASSLVIVRPKATVISREYLGCYFGSALCAQMIDMWSGGAAQPNLGAQDLAKFSIPLPPTIGEQRAIAAVLSDVDALITALDRLIAKKRAIKQGAMQELLTGKTRLPGFSGEWESASIEQLEKKGILKLSRGKVISRRDIEQNPGDYPIYSSSITNQGLFGSYGDYMFDEELVTWSIDGGGDFFYRHKHKFSVTNVSGIMKVDTAMIDYRFLAAELAVLHGRLSFDYQIKAHPSVIRKLYEMSLPSLEEQRAIATILSDMDAEIAALEARRDKTRALKQGMMQELLTGKTRLV